VVKTHLCHQVSKGLETQLLNQPDEASLLAVTTGAVVPAEVHTAQYVFSQRLTS
jgi:hypothetical protein